MPNRGSTMTHDIQNVRRLAAQLRENVMLCATDPDVDPVHDTRTGTRRLQATLEELVREMPEDESGRRVRDAATAVIRQLKKIRHAAGPVRDLDVHRKLLSKLMKRALQPEGREKAQSDGKQAEPPLVDTPDVLETPEVGLRTTGVEQQADDLDAWLKHRRSQLGADLQKRAAAMAAKLDKRLAELETALRSHPRRLRKRPPAVVALDSFARLASEIQHLHAGNLHDFRKGAKKARYVAELAVQGDTQAAQVGERLKDLQDEIGDWHDWLVLTEEAHAALGDQATELLTLLEREREEHFLAAMKTAARLRGRLMGEWLALSYPPASRTRRVRTTVA